MKAKPLTIEWKFVEYPDSEAHLLEVFEILLKNNLDEYEEPTKETI